MTLDKLRGSRSAVNTQSPRLRSLMNNKAQSVRERLEPPPQRSGADRRVRRTHHALVLALVELVLEKRYDAITIQNLLDRADVGRSTFYSHYRGKDDLLLNSFEQMLEGLDEHMAASDPGDGRVAPVRELFQHVGEFKRFQQALARAHMLDRLYQVGIVVLSRTIERKLAARNPELQACGLPLSVPARALAGALFALLRWWVDHDALYSPERMDEMFHSLRFAS